METTIIALKNTHVGNDNKQQMMTSIEIAELTGKQHKHVMEAIRKMEPAWKEIDGSNFRLVTYKDKKGELRPSGQRHEDSWHCATCSRSGSTVATSYR